MTVQLVDIEQVKLALRIDGSDGDPDIDQKILAAQEAVLEYIDGTVGDYLLTGDVLDPDLVPDRVKHAIIALVGYLLDGPDEAFEPGYMPKAVQSLLYPMREPTIA